MGALWIWIVNSKIGRAVAAVLGFITLLVVFYWKAYSDGKSKVRTQQNEENLKNLRDRSKTDDEIAGLPTAERRKRLGQWVRDDK